jgi:hypothetical protein
LPPAILDGPVELEAPVDLDTLSDLPGVLESEDSERGGLFRPRRSLAQVDDEGPGTGRADIGDDAPGAPVSLSRRRTPKLVSSHGRPVTDERTAREETDRTPAAGPGASRQATPSAGPARSEPPTLPSRRRAAALRRGTGVTDRLDELTEKPASSAFPSRELGAAPGAPALPRRTRRAEIASSGPPADDPATTATGGPGPGTSTRGAVTPAADTVTDSAPGGAVRPGRGESGHGASGASGSGRPPLGAPRGTQDAASGSAPLPRRVRQANLAPQLKQAPERRPQNQAEPAERDADEVRSRMASLQRGWQRGREENAEGDNTSGGTAPQRTTKGDGR